VKQSLFIHITAFYIHTPTPTHKHTHTPTPTIYSGSLQSPISSTLPRLEGECDGRLSGREKHQFNPVTLKLRKAKLRNKEEIMVLKLQRRQMIHEK
jgi:hypothetical protein